MHVALVTDTFQTGGGLEQLFQTVQTQHRIRFSVLARGGDARRFRGLQNTTVYSNGFGRAHLLGLKPDLIHFHHLRPLVHFFMVPLPPCNVPLFFTAHGLHVRKYDYRAGVLSEVGKHLRCVLETRFLRKVDRVIAVSREDERFLKSRYNLTNALRISNGVDIRALEQTRSSRDAIRYELHLPQDATVFLTVARFDFQKGYDVLLEAVRLGRERFRENGVVFVLVGDGGERAAMRRQAESADISDMVFFPGERNDAWRMMKASDLFILPSRWEGLPVTLLEAVFCNLPIVASDTCGNREVVRDGVNGLLFENGNSESLRRTLESAIDPARREALSIGASDGTFRQEYDIVHTSRTLESLYQEHAG
jgi:glycosyltransferase involved in cell wall biosynthesis